MVDDQKPCVIFLDDEPSILRSLERTFRRELFDIRTSEIPKEALSWVLEPRTRLFISDYRMAEMTGLEVLKSVQEMRPDLKRFILSGFADEELIKSALELGNIDQYLLKPWNVDDLRARIMSAVL